MEDLQTDFAAAERAKKCLELEVNDLHSQLEMSTKIQLEVRII